MTRITTRNNTTDPYALIDKYIDSIKEDLWELNQRIHNNPETALQEHFAHDTVTAFLTAHNRPVTRHAYGLETAFEARRGSHGPLVNLNAEYDALPGLGHACGHNLICTAGVAAFMALSAYLEETGIGGRVQLLGTPAEEDEGGKVILIQRGAYEGVDVSLMAHPASEYVYPAPYVGVSGQSTLANADLLATFTGRSAHAAANPWNGINALDAIVASYNNISLLRQQIKPDQRIHGAILETPRITNAIPEHTVLKYTVRSPNFDELKPLKERVAKCIEAGALATGCTLDLKAEGNDYADVKVNRTLSEAYTKAIKYWGVELIAVDPTPLAASTDMGNVSHAVPGLHAMVGIPADDETAFPHNEGFAKASGTREAFERFVVVAKAIAAVALRVWTEDGFLESARDDFRGKKVEH